MAERSTTTAGRIKVNLALDPTAYELLRQMAGSDRKLGSLLGDLILAETRRRQEEAGVLARMRSGGTSGSELQQALARLEESEARYDRLIERMSAVVFELSPDGEVLFVNRAITDLTGFTPEELVGAAWRELLFPNDQRSAPAERFRIFQGGDLLRYEAVVAAKDGHRIILEVTTANRYAPNGALERVVGFAVDVTQRRLAEEDARSQREAALRAIAQKEAALANLALVHAELERRVQERTAELEEATRQLEHERNLFRAVLQQMPSGVIISEAPSGRILLSNAQMERIQRRPLWGSGGMDEYAQGQGFHADGRPYEPDEWPMARALARGEVVRDEEIALPAEDGAQCIVNVNATPVRDAAGGIIAGVVTCADITERRLLEASLQEATASLVSSDEHLRSALQRTRVVVFEADRDLRYTWVGNLDPAFSFAPDEILGKRDDELFPRGDVAEVLAFKRSVIASGRGRRGIVHVGHGNHVAVYDCGAEPLCDDSGQVVGLTVVAWDITGLGRSQSTAEW